MEEEPWFVVLTSSVTFGDEIPITERQRTLGYGGG